VNGDDGGGERGVRRDGSRSRPRDEDCQLARRCELGEGRRMHKSEVGQAVGRGGSLWDLFLAEGRGRMVRRSRGGHVVERMGPYHDIIVGHALGLVPLNKLSPAPPWARPPAGAADLRPSPAAGHHVMPHPASGLSISPAVLLLVRFSSFFPSNAPIRQCSSSQAHNREGILPFTQPWCPWMKAAIWRCGEGLFL
jgi:hypothetical protein